MADIEAYEKYIAALESRVDLLRRQFLLLAERNEELHKRIAELETENA